MDVRCEKCNTEYDFDDARITEAGVTVKCTQCGFVFKVKKRTSRPPALSDELPPELSSVDKSREWKIRQLSGNIYTCRELTTLQKWIVERKVAREDEISLTGDTWKRLGNIPELAGFFIVVDQAARAAMYEQQIQAGVPLVPSAPSMPVAPPPRRSNPALGGATHASEPAWNGLAEPAEPTAPRARAARQEEVPPEEQAPDEDDLAAIRKGHAGRWVGAVVGLALAAGAGYFAYTSYAQRAAAGTPPVVVQPPRETTPAAPPPAVAAPTGPTAPTGAVAAVAPSGPTGPTSPTGAGTPAVAPPEVAAGSSGATTAPPPAAVAVKPEAPAAKEEVAKPEVAHETAPPPAAHPRPEKKPEPEEEAPLAKEKPVAVAAADKPAPKSGGGGNYEALMKQARGLEQHDKARKALEVFMQAIEAKPSSAEAWVGKGGCLYDLDRASEAAEAFKQALSIAPGFGEASLGLAQAYKSEGQKDQAIKAYQAYLAGNPTGENAEIARRNLKDLSE